jgi:hypothetical protein
MTLSAHLVPENRGKKGVRKKKKEEEKMPLKVDT